MREVEEELREAGEAAAQLRARLAQAEADLRGGGSDDVSGGGAKGEWETTEELRAKLREVFDKSDMNKVRAGRDPETLNVCQRGDFRVGSDLRKSPGETSCSHVITPGPNKAC